MAQRTALRWLLRQKRGGKIEDRVTVEALLREARSELNRLSPAEVQAALSEGALLIDIRSESQRDQDGRVPGSRFLPRNVLEWRLDPASDHRDREAASLDLQLILMCDEGYQSSLAAATLKRFGLRVTDMTGGFQAWRSAGLPVED
jgi:rhodanese-related sulfurtransferase